MFLSCLRLCHQTLRTPRFTPSVTQDSSPGSAAADAHAAPRSECGGGRVWAVVSAPEDGLSRRQRDAQPACLRLLTARMDMPVARGGLARSEPAGSWAVPTAGSLRPRVCQGSKTASGHVPGGGGGDRPGVGLRPLRGLPSSPAGLRSSGSSLTPWAPAPNRTGWGAGGGAGLGRPGGAASPGPTGDWFGLESSKISGLGFFLSPKTAWL